MNRTLIIAITVLTVIIFSPSVIPAGEAHTDHVSGKDETEIRLSKNVKRILSAEMNGIQKGMTVLAIAIPAGHWDEIAQTAAQMKESYIMNRKLSGKEREELHHSLPAGFQTLDSEFHDTAGFLRQAAKEHNADLVNSYFCRLNETCVKCHSKYAAKRFPEFRKHPEGN